MVSSPAATWRGRSYVAPYSSPSSLLSFLLHLCACFPAGRCPLLGTVYILDPILPPHDDPHVRGDKQEARDDRQGSQGKVHVLDLGGE